MTLTIPVLLDQCDASSLWFKYVHVNEFMKPCMF